MEESGTTLRGILDSIEVFKPYHLEKPYITDLSKLENMDIEPGFGEEITYATFPAKRSKSKSLTKSSKKPRLGKDPK